MAQHEINQEDLVAILSQLLKVCDALKVAVPNRQAKRALEKLSTEITCRLPSQGDK